MDSLLSLMMFLPPMARRKPSFGDVLRGGWQSLTAADPLSSEGLRNSTDQLANSRDSWQRSFSRPAKNLARDHDSK